MNRWTRCPTRVAMLVGLALSIGASVQVEQAVATESSKATVYVLRPSSFEPTTRIWTFTDELFLGATRGGSYTAAQLPEGKHLIWSKSENIASLEIAVKAGEALYILQAALPGERKARVSLTLLTETQGRKILDSCEYRPPREKEQARGEAIAVKHLAAARSVAAEEARVNSVVERARKSVFRVETENGYAAGFLVDKTGLVMASAGLYEAHFEATDMIGAMPQFAYSPSDLISVVLGRGRRAKAQLIEYDSSFRFAVLRIHPSLVEGIEPLTPSSRVPAKGDQLVAVCPGADGGITWSRAQVWRPGHRNNSDFYVDAKIDQRDRGCPFLDIDGGVVGTYWGQAFGDSQKPEVEQGRMALAYDLLETRFSGIRSKAAKQEPPPAEFLPEAPEAEYPHDMARSVAEEVETESYIARTENVHLEFLTPPLLQRLEATGSGSPFDHRSQVVRYTPSRDFFRWRDYAGSTSAVVVIQAVPVIRKTSNWSTDYWGTIAYLFNPSDRVFEPDFRRMELLRDGTPVQPVRPRRVCGRFTVDARSSEGTGGWKDKLYGCYGSYVYRPEEFVAEAGFTISVSTSAGKMEYAIPKETLHRIRADFRPFFTNRD